MKKTASGVIGTPVWVVKYALSEGIKECILVDDTFDGYYAVSWAGAPNGYLLLNCRDVAFSAIDAVAKATEMKFKKIESLKKQITKLEKKMFTIGA